MVVIPLRCHDPEEDALRWALALALYGSAVRLPQLESTRAEAAWVASRHAAAGSVLLVTSPDHAERALRTFAKAMPGCRIYVTTTALEARKCAEYAAKGDILTEAEYAAYLAWRDG